MLRRLSTGGFGIVGNTPIKPEKALGKMQRPVLKLAQFKNILKIYRDAVLVKLWWQVL